MATETLSSRVWFVVIFLISCLASWYKIIWTLLSKIAHNFRNAQFGFVVLCVFFSRRICRRCRVIEIYISCARHKNSMRRKKIRCTINVFEFSWLFLVTCFEFYFDSTSDSFFFLFLFLRKKKHQNNMLDVSKTRIVCIVHWENAHKL